MADSVIPLREDMTAHQLWESERGRYIVTRALEMAIQYIDGLPKEDRPLSDQNDMRLFLRALFPNHKRYGPVEPPPAG